MIDIKQAKTLAGLFSKRVELTPDAIAYRHYDWARQRWVDTSWAEMARETARWQEALIKSGVRRGDRVAIMLRNSREWVLFDQAALGLGLVTVPLYVEDRAENAAFILNESETKILLVEGKLQWQSLLKAGDKLPSVEQIVSVNTIAVEDKPEDPRLESLSDWLFGLQGELQTVDMDPDELVSLVYTSGTTGSPKGVMLSHRNILSNASAASDAFHLYKDEIFLSFLPLSHMFERTVTYYLSIICGFTVAFSRSVQQLADDLVVLKPTALISVPRIYERVYARIQDQLRRSSIIKRALFQLTLKVGAKRHFCEQGQAGWSPFLLLWPILNKIVAGKVLAKLGGRMRIAICGGAALPPDIELFFTSLGLKLFQGYGLTESSPVISVCRDGMSKLGSIGQALRGVQVRLGDDGELQTKSDSVMLGYWKNEAATKLVMTEDGWLRTGDLAKLDEDGCMYITGRSKEIIVLSNGEKVPPADMEMAIVIDTLFEQAMVIGENKPVLTAIIVLNKEVWPDVALDFDVDPEDEEVLVRGDIKQRILNRLSGALRRFPGYAQIKNVHLTLQPWTVKAELLTPTLKLKRSKLMDFYKREIDEMYMY